MTIKDFISQFDARLPIAQAEDFDNAGLLCGNPEREITGILVCHDALETVIDEAVEKNTNLIVCFHPIIFSGLKSITGRNYVERAVMKALENRIAIFAVHTTFDNDYFGVNFGICKALNLQNQKVLMPKKQQLKQIVVYVPRNYTEKVRQAVFDAGAGSIGFYDECSFSVKGKGTFRPLPGSDPFSGETLVRETADEDMLSFICENHKQKKIINAMQAAHPYEEIAYQIYSLDNENQYAGLGRYGDLETEMPAAGFLSFVKEQFNLKVICYTGDASKPVRRVGVLGGSGASGIKAAISAGCDAYLTGDLKYHDFYQAEGQMLLCDIGHFESEQFVTQQLFEILSEKFPKFAILKSQINTNPVNYFF